MGTLYIVPTPIGNLEDITLRALRILKEVALIAAEDTRTSKTLLQHYDIPTPMTSYHEHNKLTKLETIFDTLAHADVALISDAGTPGISDPGYELITAALERGVNVVPLPGATALIPALVGSGLPTDGFLYLGFFPKKAGTRRSVLEEIMLERRTLVAYESPYRLTETLADVWEILGDRRVCVAREISKMFEQFFRGTISTALVYYEQEPVRGEVVLVIAGASDGDQLWDEKRVRAALLERVEAGESLSYAAKAVAKQSGWRKGDVYKVGIED